MARKMISYQHPDDKDTWFVQYKGDELPAWAVDVRDYQEPPIKQAMSREAKAATALYNFVGRDFAHLEPKEALEAWYAEIMRKEQK